MYKLSSRRSVMGRVREQGLEIQEIPSSLGVFS